MAAEEERAYLKSLGSPEARDDWSKLVDKMSDEKVIEVYLDEKTKEEA